MYNNPVTLVELLTGVASLMVSTISDMFRLTIATSIVLLVGIVLLNGNKNK